MKITTKQTAFISVIAIILLALAIGTAAKISQTSLGTHKKTTVVTSNPTTNSVTTTTNCPTTTIATTSEKNEPSTVVAVTFVETSLGYFKITVYCPSSDGGRWGYNTSTGVRSSHLKTCAVDPNVIPLGSTIKVGDLVLEAIDTGSEVNGNVVDIFYDGTESEALSWIREFGTRHEVYIIE